jgi:hypothetical protein
MEVADPKLEHYQSGCHSAKIIQKDATELGWHIGRENSQVHPSHELDTAFLVVDY